MSSSGNQPVLQVSEVYKKFSRSTSRAIFIACKKIFRKVLGLSNKSKNLSSYEFWALNNVSFDLYSGEVVGLVGLNGSGKTTLLKCICGLLNPDSGQISSGCRIVGLFASGAGFNPALTGYENVRLYLSLLGLRGEELETQVKCAVAFSELKHEELVSPIRTYSSGMKARLGFGCVVMSKPNVLIVDEALAVGDMRFRQKCYREISSLKKSGVSFLLVSHSSSVILSHCDRVIYLQQGSVIESGSTKLVMERYERDLQTKKISEASESNDFGSSVSGEFLTFQGVKVFSHTDRDRNLVNIPFGTSVVLSSHLRVHNSITEPLYFKIICRELNAGSDIVFEKNLELKEYGTLKKGSDFNIDLEFLPLALRPGDYTLKLFLTTNDSFNVLAAVESVRIKVVGEIREQGLYFQTANMVLNELKAEAVCGS